MKKKLLFILLLILVGYYLWRWWKTHDAAEGGGQAIFYNRVWLDRIPERDTDAIQSFAAITDEPMGLFHQGSQWKGGYELYRYEPRGDGRLVMLFPQSKEKRSVSYRAWNCHVKKFDYCLDVSGAGRGVEHYFSQKGWEIGGGGARGMEAAMEHVLTESSSPQ